jgi:hypothetical protein
MKFNDAITKVGPPPTISKTGVDIQMCASYHLRGSCKNSVLEQQTMHHTSQKKTASSSNGALRHSNENSAVG